MGLDQLITMDDFEDCVVLGPMHPGAYLREAYLEEGSLTAYRLAVMANIGHSTMSKVLNGKQSITPSIAGHLAACLGTSIDFWLNMQRKFDLAALHANEDYQASIGKVERLIA